MSEETFAYSLDPFLGLHHDFDPLLYCAKAFWYNELYLDLSSI